MSSLSSPVILFTHEEMPHARLVRTQGEKQTPEPRVTTKFISTVYSFESHFMSIYLCIHPSIHLSIYLCVGEWMCAHMFAHVHTHTHTHTHTNTNIDPRRQLWQSVLSFHHVGSGHQTPVVRLDSKHLLPLRHRISPVQEHSAFTKR